MKPKAAPFRRQFVFNALIVSPFSHAIICALDLGYTQEEVDKGIRTALDHAHEERKAYS